MDHLLTMTSIGLKFGATTALEGVDLVLDRGEILALVGENGAGKSSLMKVLSGVHLPLTGEMRMEGARYRPRTPREALQAGVAMIYQELSIAPHLSVEENIFLGKEPVRWGVVRRTELRRRAREALHLLGHDDIAPESKAGKLPIAEQQLVEIAKAVAQGCRVLVLDEPTSSLTSADVERLFGLLRRLSDQGIGIIYISHFLEELQKIAGRYMVMRDGHVVGSGPLAGASMDVLVSLMVGRDVPDLYPRSLRARGEVVLTIDNLRGERKPTQASLTLHRGEVVGIAGLIGAGRTELLRAVFGLDPIRRGEVVLKTFTGVASPARRWEQGMGMLAEDRKREGLALSQSVGDNITLPHLRKLGPAGIVLPRRERERAGDMINRLRIKCTGPNHRVNDLSGGNQQKIAIARMLDEQMDVLLLDEPTRGIDVGSKADVYRLIDELAARGKAILMVSSYLPELLGVCDRVAVMSKGTLFEARPVNDITEETIMREATGVT
jgi:ribose transport system ATP-binding protein